MVLLVICTGRSASQACWRHAALPDYSVIIKTRGIIFQEGSLIIFLVGIFPVQPFIVFG